MTADELAAEISGVHDVHVDCADAALRQIAEWMGIPVDRLSSRIEQDHRAVTRAIAAEAERDALKAAIETNNIAHLAADVLSLVDDYTDREQSVIARLPFLATFDQVCFEKYGLNTDRIAALAVPETPEES